MRILTIDFSAESTGLAFGVPGAAPPVLWSRSFARWEGATVAEVSSAVQRWLPRLFKAYEPDWIIFEAAIPRIVKGQMPARFGLGFDFLLQGMCHVNQIKCMPLNHSKWTATVLGHGGLPTKEGKRRSLAVAEEMGLSAKNDDESDAACMFYWFCAVHLNTPGLLAQLAQARRRWA